MPYRYGYTEYYYQVAQFAYLNCALISKRRSVIHGWPKFSANCALKLFLAPFRTTDLEAEACHEEQIFFIIRPRVYLKPSFVALPPKATHPLELLESCVPHWPTSVCGRRLLSCIK